MVLNDPPYQQYCVRTRPTKAGSVVSGGRHVTARHRSAAALEWRKLYKTKAWRKGRLVFLSEHRLCERCLAQGRYTIATVVNHRTPHKGDEVLFFRQSNWEAICKRCHDGPVQQIERRGYSNEIGLDGFPLDPNHPANL